MTTATRQASFPRWFVIGTAVLMLTAIFGAGLARFLGVGLSRVADSPVTGTVEIWIDEQRDGTALVRHAATGKTLEILPADGGGFVRGLVRGMFRQRLLGQQARTLPFQLSQREGPKYFLFDPATGTRMELDGFGPTNTQSIARLYEAARNAQAGQDAQPAKGQS